MERLIHSPKMIFNFNSTIQYSDYMIDQQNYEKLLLTIEYIRNNYFKKLEYKYLDEEQTIEIHRWVSNNCYVEYRNFENEDITDIIMLDLFENTEDTYQNLLIFQTKEPINGIYNRLIIGNDYFNNGYVLTEDFEWNIYDECGMIDIQREEMDLEEIGVMKLNQPYNYDLKNILDSFCELIRLD